MQGLDRKSGDGQEVQGLAMKAGAGQEVQGLARRPSKVLVKGHHFVAKVGGH